MASGSRKTATEITQAMKNVSKGQDMKQDMVLLMAPHASWEEHLVPAPISIALLGEMMLISTDTDFTLDKNPPEGGFKLLKWPKSFRACLAQVGHSGWDAFNEAHKNMDQIRLHTLNVPTHLKNAVQILMKGSNEDVEEMLPIPLGNIKMTAEKCLRLATSVEERFVHVMNLTAELLEACTNARGQYEQDLRDTEIAISVAKQHEEAISEEKKMAKEQFEMLKGQVKEAEGQFKEAINSLPSGWELIGMSAVESIVNGFNSFVSTITFQGSRKKAKAKKPGAQGDASKDERRSDESLCRVYKQIDLLKTMCIDPLVGHLIDSDGNLNSEALARGNHAQYCLEQSKRFLTYVRKEKDSQLKQDALNLYNRVIDMCEGLKGVQNQFQRNEQEINLLVENMIALQNEVNMLTAEGKMLFSTTPLEQKAPNQAAWSPNNDGDESIVQQTIKNARFKTEQASAHLKHTQDKFDTACERLKESNQKLGAILADIGKYDMQKIDFKRIKETLIKGIHALGEVREQWGKLVQFFQMMSNLIDCSLNTSLQNFLAYCEKGQGNAIKGYSISSLQKDMIYQQAFETAKIAHLVHMISGSYVEVSDKFLVNRVAALSKLLAYDAETQQNEIRQERLKLHQGCREAQEGIQELVERRKLEFDQQLQARMGKIRREMDACLPPVPTEEKNKIEEVLKESVKRVAQKEKSAADLKLDDFL